MFRGADTSQAEEREAFARSQGVKPRKSVSAAEFLNGDAANGRTLVGTRHSDMSRRSGGSMRSLLSDMSSRRGEMSRTNSKESVAAGNEDWRLARSRGLGSMHGVGNGLHVYVDKECAKT